MAPSSRTTTIQITLLNDAATPQLRGRIRLAGGATLPFVGTRELVTHLRALLQAPAHTPPQMTVADTPSASAESLVPDPPAALEEMRRKL